MHFQAITTLFCLLSQMTDNICKRLLKNKWSSYANDLDEVPEAGGIYAIGDKDGTVLYVGQSEHMRTRLRQHKSRQQEINELVQQQFAANGGTNLRIKWMEDPNHKCVEGEYLECIEKLLGSRPPFNKKGGNKCD